MRTVINTIFNIFITFPYAYDDLFRNFRNIKYNFDINLQWCYKGYPFRTLVHNTLINNNKYKIFHAEFLRYQDCHGNNDILYQYFKCSHKLN